MLLSQWASVKKHKFKGTIIKNFSEWHTVLNSKYRPFWAWALCEYTGPLSVKLARIKITCVVLSLDWTLTDTEGKPAIRLTVGEKRTWQRILLRVFPPLTVPSERLSVGFCHTLLFGVSFGYWHLSVDFSVIDLNSLSCFACFKKENVSKLIFSITVVLSLTPQLPPYSDASTLQNYLKDRYYPSELSIFFSDVPQSFPMK